MVRDLDIGVSRYLLSSVDAPGVVHQAFDMGINFFLLGADLHWPKYEGTRTGLRDLLRRRPGIRDEMIVVAMSYAHQSNAAAVAFQEVLDAVPELRRLDVLTIGGAEEHVFLPRSREYRAYVEEAWVGARVSGACFEDYDTALVAMKGRAVDLALVTFYAGRPYDPSFILSYERQENTPPLYSFASAHSYRTIDELNSSPLPPSKWLPLRSDYFRYVMTWSAFDGTVCSSMSGERLDELALAIAKGPLNDEELLYLADLEELMSGRARLLET